MTRWLVDMPASRRFPVYTRANASDVMPDPVSPLCATLTWQKGNMEGWREGYVANYAQTIDELTFEGINPVAGIFNGYYYNNRWYYGPPPVAYYGSPGYRPGYTAWRRGSYLPSYYRGHGYVVNDYYRYQLRPPPRGYYWYRTGNDYVLAAIATGLIFDVIANH